MAVRRQRLAHGGASSTASSQQRRYSAKQLEEQGAEQQQQRQSVEQQLLQQAEGAEYSGREVLYSWGSDGRVLVWELDAEHNCDIYRTMVGGCCGARPGLARLRDGASGAVVRTGHGTQGQHTGHITQGQHTGL